MGIQRIFANKYQKQIKNLSVDTFAFLNEGKVPASLLVDKMTLISKKEPSLDVAKKHSL